ncbi:MAG: mannose-6-phosphate isomerase [Firmicutes bacterium]|nr:mannose-6-phosphate isomerase [Bacillota bacterium]
MENQKPIVLKLTPTFKERIWGGQKLKPYYSNLPAGNIGECWGISAHPQGESVVTNTEAKGLTLSQVYAQYPHWFNGAKSSSFPLLVKIIDAREDLSVQVHPDDAYAQKHEQQFGKHESWIVLATGDHPRIQLGHHAKTKADFQKAIEDKSWATLLQYSPLAKDDVVDIAPGTLHALCAGTMVLEIQQSSDVTYRVYDYDRRDKHGQLRPLHLSKAIEVTTVPFVPPKQTILNRNVHHQLMTLIENSHYMIESISINEKKDIRLPLTKYRLGTVIEGNIWIGHEPFYQGDHFIITSTHHQFSLHGKGMIIFTQTKN